MSVASKTRVGVLRGGPSREHDVSLKTGAHVLKHLPEGYTPVDVYIDKQGVWHMGGVVRKPAKVLPYLDVVFNALHGEYGEDGKLQHLLDLFHMPYTGSGRLASALAMQKAHAKQILARHGIRSPYCKVVKRSDALRDARALWRVIPNPSIVKPVGLGSSLGVSIAGTLPELQAALEKAFALADAVLVEEYIRGREATCGIIENFRGEELYPMLPVEFSHVDGVSFLDYDAKYGEKPERRSAQIHPGRFSAMEKEAIQKAAQTVHQILGLRHYSRSDFILSPRRGLYFLEVNSLPGLYADAPFTESLASLGTAFSDFLDHVLRLARTEK